MRLAIGLGARMRGRVWPNPAVGCVIAREGVVVGRGATAPGGRPHAETQALARAAAAARGATAYVSLEPCAHHGQTPPCTDALIAAGVGRMVTALTDPDPRVAGQGHAALRAAGIAVTEGVEATAARAVQAGFLSRIQRGRPWVILKLALTLDGRIATAAGESRWITGPPARRAVHALRAGCDAVLVGAGTAQADDPDLSVRDLGTDWQPVRVVLDSRLRLSPDCRLGRSARAAPVWLCHGAAAGQPARAAWAGTGAQLLHCDSDASGRVRGDDALARLGAAGLTRVLCEGGGVLAAGLLRAGLVDEVVTITAGRVLGGDGRPGVGALDLVRLADGPRLSLVDSRPLGDDLWSCWAVRQMG